MPKPYSTKRPRPIPEEFASFFIAHGWERCDAVFGKRETLRYYRALGAERLSAERRAAQRGAAA